MNSAFRVNDRLLVTCALAIVLLTLGLLVRFPGSIPRGWKHEDGWVTSVIGHNQSGTTLYYPVVQYLGQGYTHEVTATQGLTYYPQFNTKIAVAYDPDEPNNVKVVSEARPNYFGLLFPLLALAVLLVGLRPQLRSVAQYFVHRRLVKLGYAEATVELETQLPAEKEPTEEQVEAPTIEPAAEPMPLSTEVETAETITSQETTETVEVSEEVESVNASEPELPVGTEAVSEAPIAVEPIVEPGTVIEPEPEAIPEKKTKKPRKAKAVLKLRPSKPKKIYIPHIAETAPEEESGPRTAGKLKSKLKENIGKKPHKPHLKLKKSKKPPRKMPEKMTISRR